jgi:phosphate/sulfate permease
MAIVLRDFADLSNHPYIACIVLMALIFDFLNGFHDAAKSIATIRAHAYTSSTLASEVAQLLGQ